MVAHNRRLDLITLEIEGVAYECQITEWHINPPDNVVGDKVWTFCPDGEFREEVDPADWTLALNWVTDWRTAGLDRLLWANQGAVLDFTLVNHPSVTGEKVTWTGQVYGRAPNGGGAARTTEVSEAELIGVGDLPVPTYA